MEDTTVPLEAVRRLIEATTAAEPDEAVAGALLAPDLQHVTHPNAFFPNGSVEDREAMLTAARLGRAQMASQHWEIHEIAETSAGAVVVRATFTGALVQGFGVTLKAEVAAFYTVREGRVSRIETFNCFYPLGTA
jgi:ketosteroid isomerase-like protein